MSARAFEIMANLAKRRPLRGIQTVCETQHQISTRKLEHYTETAGDELAGYAFNLRNEFDKITKERDAALKQVEGLQAAIRIARQQLYQVTISREDEREVERAIVLIDAALTTPSPQ